MSVKPGNDVFNAEFAYFQEQRCLGWPLLKVVSLSIRKRGMMSIQMSVKASVL